jgi:hypothetical protein
MFGVTGRFCVSAGMIGVRREVKSSKLKVERSEAGE